MNRRKTLKQLGALALLASPAGSGAVSLFRSGRPIRDFGKVYLYLKDHDLRTAERGSDVIEVKGAVVDERFS
ncbi:MAG: hypothetical protein LBI31_00255, partial [Zoogloeaceae bacterium]|nr:hypothetical protein [Zoogloeaceae bacterium]